MGVKIGTGVSAEDMYLAGGGIGSTVRQVSEMWVGIGGGVRRVSPEWIQVSESMALPNGYLDVVASPRWTARTGTRRPGVESSQVRNKIDGTSDGTWSGNAVHNTVMNSDNMFVKASIALPLNHDRLYSHISIRADSSYANFVAVDLFNSTAVIVTCVNGVIAARGSVGTSLAAGSEFSLRSEGRYFAVHRNGSEILTWDDRASGLSQMGPNFRSCGLGVQCQRGGFVNRYSAALSQWSAGEISPFGGI